MEPQLVWDVTDMGLMSVAALRPSAKNKPAVCEAVSSRGVPGFIVDPTRPGVLNRGGGCLSHVMMPGRVIDLHSGRSGLSGLDGAKARR